MKIFHWNGKIVLITDHAIIRAKQREISFPDQVYNAIQTGMMVKFGKHGVKFIKRLKEGSIICIGEIISHRLVIKTVERGN